VAGRRPIADDAWALGEPLAALPDGGAVPTYGRGDDVLLS